jgi:hypothetical protein
MPHLLECPRCGVSRFVKIGLWTEAQTRVVLCKTCTRTKLATLRLGVTKYAPPDPDGMVRYPCPRCGRTKAVRFEQFRNMGGKKTRCSVCTGKDGSSPKRKHRATLPPKPVIPAPVNRAGCSPLKRRKIGHPTDACGPGTCSGFYACLDHAAKTGWDGWEPSGNPDLTGQEMDLSHRMRMHVAMLGDCDATSLDPRGDRI